MSYRNMKVLFFLVTMISIQWGYTQTQFSELTEREGRTVTAETGQLFTGKALAYYSNGALRREAHFTQGLLDGTDMRWYADGTPMHLTTLEKGERSGPEKKWFESGVLKESLSFKNNQINGKATYYFKDGTLQKLETYRNCTRHGKNHEVVSKWRKTLLD